MAGFKDYFLAARPQFLPAVIVPVALGASTAWQTSGAFNAGYFALTLIAAALYHLGMNVLNDYFDYLNGSDNINKDALTPFTGGSRYIQRKILTPSATLKLSLALLTLGSAVGVYLAIKTSPLIFFIGAFGLVTGVFYSAPPVFLAGRGLGELTVGVNFGILTVCGAYIVQTSTLAIEPVVASLPVSFLVAALLYINEFPDYDADRLSGKKTLVVRLGPDAGRYFIIIMTAGAYLSIIAGAFAGYLPRASLIALITSIFALQATMGLIKHYRGGGKLIPSIKSIIAAHLSSGILLAASNIF